MKNTIVQLSIKLLYIIWNDDIICINETNLQIIKKNFKSLEFLKFKNRCKNRLDVELGSWKVLF
jgi:hypothetical protein